MVQKSSVNQLRLVVEIPLFTTGFSTIPGGCLAVGMTPYIKKVMKVMIFFFSSFILSRCLKTSTGCTVVMEAPNWEMEEILEDYAMYDNPGVREDLKNYPKVFPRGKKDI